MLLVQLKSPTLTTVPPALTDEIDSALVFSLPTQSITTSKAFSSIASVRGLTAFTPT